MKHTIIKTTSASLLFICLVFALYSYYKYKPALSLSSLDRDEAVFSIMEAMHDGTEQLSVRVSAKDAEDLTPEKLTGLFTGAVYNDCCDLPVYPSGMRITSEAETDGACTAELSLIFDGISKSEYRQYRREYRKILNRYVKELENLKEDPEKLYRTVFYFVCAHTEYDDALAAATLSRAPEAWSGAALAQRGAWGALVSGKSICTGYAMLYKALCDRLGLPCWVVVGETPEGPHAWNMVLLNGEIRYVDTSEGDRGSKTDASYCLMREIRYKGLNRDTGESYIPSSFFENTDKMQKEKEE